MNMRKHFAPVCLVLAAALTSLAHAAEPVKKTAEAHPSADAILRQMSDTLGDARQFSFKGTREIASSLAADKSLQSRSEFDIVVRRPNKLDVRSTSSEGLRRMIFDGQAFTMVDSQQNTYATVALNASLDELPAQLAKTYGFVPPMADFMQSDPYQDFRRRAQAVSYLGLGTAGTPPEDCHRLALKGKLADAELCVGTKSHLPLRMTARVKGGVDAGVDLKIEFGDWNLIAPVTDQTFAFTPAGRAQKIPMVTTSEIEAAMAKSGAKK